MPSVCLVQSRPRPIHLFELLDWLVTKRAVTAIALEKKFLIGIITSKEIIDGLIELGVLKRGSFFHPVNSDALARNRKIAAATIEESFRPMA